ncbi:SanA/YdcF family protein [Moheibacter lacus]|uniref:YdcF family protein n=1 Tax=Moheibacter lacus TaxID=2745851 RepID=A0A838ZRK6_9FLAO|nr:ElyC/SanA/YdcF family protein [Moheibacter lacus]MBA5628259.1 YdcF family protein [Moheibacter lacus]
MKTILRRFWKMVLGGIILFTSILLFSNFWVEHESKGKTYDDLQEIPENPTGLVLGTSKRVRGGGENLYFKYRMQAAVELFKSGKVKFLIVSGDNSIMEYNETRDMKNELIKMGIPEDKIVEDFAGFSTLDSVLRAKEVFGQDSLTIISQEFHNERAIFIGKNHDIYSLGFNANNVPKGYSTITITREYFARVKALLDVYILETMPKFYKDKESFPNEE